MKRFVVATQNRDKLVEIARLLRPIGIEPVSLTEAGVDFSDVEETGQTFLKNAQIKARAAFEKSGLPSIGDDSGLAVDALNGAPGIYSARYAGEGATNEMRIEKLLGNLEGVEKENAQPGLSARCAACSRRERSSASRVNAKEPLRSSRWARAALVMTRCFS